MSESEYCQLVNILIPKYIIGQCTKAEGALLGEHCVGCLECRAKLARAFKDSPTITGEVLFLSRPRNLKIYQKLDSKGKLQKVNIERDYFIDWKDSVLKSRMQEITGIQSRNIKYSDIKTITELDLSGNDSEKINDISALGNLRNLTSLNLEDNQISGISALSNLTNLTSLGLGYNQISDISALSNLTNLTSLGLGGNQISDIRVLSNLTNLTSLKLQGNQISDISALSNLTNLTSLNLQGNQISDISALSNLTNLTCLNLGSNQISDISALHSLKKLHYLTLKGNKIIRY